MLAIASVLFAGVDVPPWRGASPRGRCRFRRSVREPDGLTRIVEILDVLVGVRCARIGAAAPGLWGAR
jgi:hypothetical protein